ncbi:MAG TPA: hypothetical protein VH640_27085 [Bryobacteraceae bacterium]
MTIDERLEALTQSLELMAAMQRDNETQIADLTQSMKEASESAKQASESAKQASESAKQASESVKQMSEAILVTSVRQNIQENEIEEHKKRLDEMQQFRYRTEQNLAEITGKLNALIDIVDGIVRDRKRNGQP